MLFKKIIQEGDIIPNYPWYIPVYHEYTAIDKLYKVHCYPLPIGIIVIMIIKLDNWLMKKTSISIREEIKYLRDRVKELTEINDELIQQIQVLDLINKPKKG